MLACHAGGPGSIPGRCIPLLLPLAKAYRQVKPKGAIKILTCVPGEAFFLMVCRQGGCPLSPHGQAAAEGGAVVGQKV